MRGNSDFHNFLLVAEIIQKVSKIWDTFNETRLDRDTILALEIQNYQQGFDYNKSGTPNGTLKT